MESQIRKVMCIGCSCLFPISNILKHLSKLQTCRNQYTEEDFAKLKQLCEAEAKRKKSIRKATRYKLNQENKESLSVESENPSLTSLNPKYKCKGCSKILSVNSIMNHIVNKPDCLNQYSQNDLDEQKKQCKDHQNNKRRNKRISSNKETYERSKKRRNLEKKNQSDGKESEQKQISKESLVNEDDCEEVDLPLEFVTDMLNDDSDGNIDNSEEDVEDFKCRGCKKWFKSNTILKHLKSPKVLCISEYHSYEIEELEDMSKMRKAMANSIWKRNSKKNDPDHYRRIKQDLTIRRKINRSIKECNVRNVKKALMDKIAFERNEMLSIWNEYLFNETPSVFMHHIAQWRKEIVSEINETYRHLKEEIADTTGHYCYLGKPRMASDFNSYYNHSSVVYEKNAMVLISKASECIVNDKVIFISKGTKYTILKSSIAQEMESLLHYIEWRLENSYALIVWKTIKFAEEINKKMAEEYFEYYIEITTQKDEEGQKFYDPWLKKFTIHTYTEMKPIKFDGDLKGKKSFPYYNEIVSTQIPSQDPYVPLFDVQSLISKMVVEYAEYRPSKILRCSSLDCNYSSLDLTAFRDHESMVHSTNTECWLLLARIAYGKKTLDPNYMGSFDGNSPLNFCDGCTHLIVNCCCPKTNKFAEWYSFMHE